MRFTIVSITLLLSTAVGGVLADDNLHQIVERMPGCAVSCYADAASYRYDIHSSSAPGGVG
ncbi:hypothetical protein PG996_010816 [Apiospora saccharicola]|uniref:Uncharacterized protein n=1 Tax=Apiospora saccharicola TaxID=335842 RepID=A0ABR1UPN8_9PEZI